MIGRCAWPTPRGFARFAHVARAARVAAAVVVASLLAGCSPHIGSGCTAAADCSSQGERVCDTAQPGGYCTVLNCIGNAVSACPDNAVCVEFQSAVPGCPYDDYQSPSRTGISFCMQQCGSNSDCRGGYVCADPLSPPWSAAILDNDQNQSVCIAPIPTGADAGSTQDGAVGGGVCTPTLPDLPDAFPLTFETLSTDDGGAAPADAAPAADAPAGD